MTTPQAHPNAELLRTLYTDLTRVGEYAADDIVYHPAERDTPQGAPDIHGKDAVIAKEHALFEATHGTLVADIEAVIANDHFGAIMGVFRARTDPSGNAPEFAMPFCGLWRFNADGRITDHWQNAYEPTVVAALFTPPDAIPPQGQAKRPPPQQPR